jgi:DNA-binding transcriptional regulator GbsR (MarR family)
MKNDTRPRSLDKIPRLTPALHTFIEGMGMYFEVQGIPRIGGRILGLLMIAHAPLSAEDIAATLHVSRGSLSTNFRLLLASGMVERVTAHGDRVTYFVFSDSAMEQRIAVGLRSVAAFKRLCTQALDALAPHDPSRHHLDISLEWSDLLTQSFEAAMAEWHERRLAAARAASATSAGRSHRSQRQAGVAAAKPRSESG